MSLETGSQIGVETVLVAGNRGPCGGVNMANEATKQVLDFVDGREPVYTLWDVVNNIPSMKRHEKRGLINVNRDWDRIPNGGILIFPAHGKPPSYAEIAEQKGLLTIDATCQLVTRVHALARRAQEAGRHVIYIGKKDHPETVGVLGELEPENVTFIEADTPIEEVELKEGVEAVVYSQTTLSTNDIRDQQGRLKLRFPEIVIPSRWDICPAVELRQGAAEDLLDHQPIDFFLVGGSQKSHNSRELQRKAEERGIPSALVDDPEQIKPEWFKGVSVVGATSGASEEELDFQLILDFFRRSGIDPVVYLPQFIEERDMIFKLPQADMDALHLRYN